MTMPKGYVSVQTFDHMKKLKRESYERHKVEQLERAREQNTGVSPEQYDAMLLAQCGKCAICGAVPDEKRALAVDHDHNTLRVRGLLCSGCNVAVGRVEAEATSRFQTDRALTMEDAEQIRLALAQGQNQYQLATWYGVHQTAISHIKLGKTYRKEQDEAVREYLDSFATDQ